MSASTATSPIIQTRAMRRDPSEPTQVPAMRRGRPDEKVIKEQAGIALAKISERGELRFSSFTTRQARMRQWLKDEVIDMSQFSFGKNTHAERNFLRAVVNFMTNSSGAGQYAIMTSAQRGGLIVTITAVGRQFLQDRARELHPSGTASMDDEAPNGKRRVNQR